MIFATDWLTCLIDVSVNATDSEEANLGRECDYLLIEIPTITSANLSLKVSRTSGGTFQALGSGSQLIAAGTGAFTTTVKLGGYQFIKIISSVSQAADITFRVRGMRS